MQAPTFHRGPYRHPFSDDPEDQHPPTNTLLFSNPPLDAALDEFSKLLESQPGYLHSSAGSLGSQIHYLAEFDGEPAAQAALLKLYGLNFSSSKQGPLRCSFAEPRRATAQQPAAERPDAECPAAERPAAEHPAAEQSQSIESADWSAPHREPSGAQDQFWPVHRRRHNVHPDLREPTTTLLIKFPASSSARRTEVREIVERLSGFQCLRFAIPVHRAVQRSSDCGYTDFDSTSAAADAKLSLESTKLCGFQHPLRVMYKLPESDEGPRRRSTVPVDVSPPAKKLYVTFIPNTPSMQLDIKTAFTQQPGFVRLDFVEPWAKETSEAGHCYVHFDTIDAATATRKELNGRPPRPGTRRLRVLYSRSDSPPKPSGADTGHGFQYEATRQAEVFDDTTADSRERARATDGEHFHPSNAAGPPHVMTPWTQGRRAEREEPTASLYMANLASDLTSAEAYDLFWIQEGVLDVRYILKRQPHFVHPMVFVDFRDIASAAQAKDRLWGAILKGRPLRPHFNSNPPNRIVERPLPTRLCNTDGDEDDNGEARAVLVLNIQGRIGDTQMRNVFSTRKGFQTFKWGGTFFSRRAVIYYDDADCAAQTVEELDGYKFDYSQADGLALHLRSTTVRAAETFLAVVPDSGTPSYDQDRAHPESTTPTQNPAHWGVALPEYEDSLSPNNVPVLHQYANSDSGYSEPDKFDDSQDEELTTRLGENDPQDQDITDVATAGSSPPLRIPTHIPAVSDPHARPAPDAPDLMPDYVSPMSPKEKTSNTHTTAAQAPMSTTRQRRASPSSSSSHKQHLMSLFTRPTPSSGSAGISTVSSQGSASGGTNGEHVRVMSAADDLKDLHSFYTSSDDKEGSTQPEQAVDRAERPSPRKEVRDSALLDMPMEIRDHIYHLVFNSTLVLMTGINAFRQYSAGFFPTTATNATTSTGIRPDVFPCLERHSRLPECPIVYGRRPPLPEQVFGRALSCFSIPFQRKHSMRGLSARPTNASLLLACRQLSSEFREHIQGRLILAFSSQSALLQHFDIAFSDRARRSAAGKVIQDDQTLTRLAPHVAKRLMDKSLQEQYSISRRSLVQNLSLEIGLYGEPHAGNLRGQRSKYYDNWKRACQLVAEELPDLQHVAVSVHVPPTVDTKVSQLNLTALWAQPLMEFGKVGKLQTASVTLVLRYHSHGCTVDTGRGFAEVMRRKMMGLTDEVALEALAECKAGQRHSPSNPLTQHNAWVEVETSNGLPAIGLSEVLGQQWFS